MKCKGSLLLTVKNESAKVKYSTTGSGNSINGNRKSKNMGIGVVYQNAQTRNSQAKSSLNKDDKQCYNFHRWGHMRNECPSGKKVFDSPPSLNSRWG